MAEDLGRFEVVAEPVDLGRFTLVDEKAPDMGRFELVEDEPLIPPVITDVAKQAGGAIKEFGKEALGLVEAGASVAGGFLEFLNPLPGLAAAGKEEIAEDLSAFEEVNAGSPLGASFEALETNFANSVEEATANIERAQELSKPFLVYEPQTEAGKTAQERIGKSLDFLIARPARTMGELAQKGSDALGLPTNLGAAIGAGVNITAELLGFSALLGGAKVAKTRGKIKRGETLTPVEKVEFEKGLEEIAIELETRVREAPVRAQKVKTKVIEENSGSVRADPLPPEPVRETVRDVVKQEPIELRELPPEQPAAGGLAFEAELPKMAEGINLERVTGPKEIKRVLLDTATSYKGAITEARRGKITHDLTREMADSLGVSERAMRKVAKRKPGGVLNAEELLAARDWLNSSGREVKTFADRWIETRSPEDLVDFRKAQARHAALQAEVAGASTEAGRALSSLRIASQEAKNLDAILESLGGKDLSEQMIEKFARIDPTDTLSVNHFLSNAHRATTGEMIFEIWVNALLSSPKTHVVNTVSNALTFLTKLPEETLASSIDFAIAKVKGRPRERFFGEVPQHMYGLWEGIKSGTRKGVQAFITEVPSQGVSKLEQTRFQAVPGRTGRVVRIPGRALVAMDEFFKAINFEAELHSEAYRIAAKEGLKGRERSRRMAEVIQDPPADVLKRSQEEMLYRVFQKDLGSFGKTLQRARIVDPSGVLKWIVPFMRTPINIAKFGLERSPLYFPLIAKRALKGELAKGVLADELAKATMGSGIAATVGLLAKEGRVTGAGPKDPTKRQNLFATGWQPYSIQVGDEYFSYGRLEPLGTVMGLTADFMDLFDTMSEGEREDIAAKIGLAVAQNITNKTFMQGLSDALNAVSDPARYGEAWTERFIGTAIPRGVAALARAQDPILRDPQTFKEIFKAQLPFLSPDVLPKRDLWGEEIRRTTEGVEALVSPVRRSPVKGKKLDFEMIRLDINVGMPEKNIRGIDLTAEEYDELIETAGKWSRKRLDAKLRASGYNGRRDESKRQLIRKTIMAGRERARGKMFGKIRRRRRAR